MAKTDLILLHAPSVYDFRKKSMLFGPVSDVVPSTQAFEMYPLGFIPMLEHLEKNGLSVRIINIAGKMLNNKNFNVEKCIKKLKTEAFGIDLHWMVHAHGSIELAKIIKKYHPEKPIIFGGLSSSYFHKELLEYPEIDFVLRGDSVEAPLRMLVSSIKSGKKNYSIIPNLTWRDKSRVVVNKLSHVPIDMNNISFDYRAIMRSSLKHFDILGHIPFRAWINYPIVAALTCRGCIHSCAICGGSSQAYKKILKRSTPAYIDPGKLAENMGIISRHIKAPIMVLGDILQPGVEYAKEFITSVKKEKIKNSIALEFFYPPPKDILEMAGESFFEYNIQMSPESHDERVRKAFGREYSNKDLENSIKDAFNCGCSRFDLFFMTGIPLQDRASVRKTIKYCGTLLEKFKNNHFRPFISPLAPFLDPGSIIFENPGKYGYKLFCKTVEEHRKALIAPSWKYTLNYETKWMNRDEIVESTYEAAEKLNILKIKYGLISENEGESLRKRIKSEREMIREIDQAVKIHDKKESKERIKDIMEKFIATGLSTICQKYEMNWPTAFLKFNIFEIAKTLLLKNRGQA